MTLLPISGGVIVALLYALYRMMTRNVDLMVEKDVLADELHRMRMAQLNAPPKQMTSGIDATTKKLVRLAMDNTNQHESRNAAMKVCERLSKKL